MRGRPWKAAVWVCGTCVGAGGRVSSMRDLGAEFTSGPGLVTVHVIHSSVCACAPVPECVCLRSSLGSLRIVAVSGLVEPRAAPVAIGAQNPESDILSFLQPLILWRWQLLRGVSGVVLEILPQTR